MENFNVRKKNMFGKQKIVQKCIDYLCWEEMIEENDDWS